MDTANKQIEQQITVLLRRVQRIHLSTTSGDVNLERSAYGIMCKLADEGPQRLGALAVAFGLDPSTITRQVQALEVHVARGRGEMDALHPAQQHRDLLLDLLVGLSLIHI